MLTIEGLNQFYGSSHVLRQVKLHVADGGCTVLLGRNGVGKTTLLRCLMGLLPIRSGQVAFNGQDVAHWTPEARAQAGMGYVPQGREVFPELTVRENLMVGEFTAGRRPRVGVLWAAGQQLRFIRGDARRELEHRRVCRLVPRARGAAGLCGARAPV